ncbi:putative ribonuclease H protein, partial [Trifolium medium]|nr:putative ribonuclease H protein [Trifolium medium]
MISSREGLIWRWEWRDSLTQSEEHDLIKLKELLLDVNLNPNSADRWRWIIGSASLFSVNSCYNFLVLLGSSESINPTMLVAIKNLWKNDVPSKVHVENCSHLFYSCNFTQMVWNAIFKWMGCSITI